MREDGPPAGPQVVTAEAWLALLDNAVTCW